MSRRVFHAFALTGLLALCSAGCAGYRLGTGSHLEFASLHVAPVQMRALVPQAQPLLTSAVREAFLKDGRVTIATSREAAEATLQIVVRDYRRDIATVRPGDTGLARKFIVTLAVDATLTSTRDGSAFFSNRRLEAKRDVFTDSGQQHAEYQILPLLAQDLADKLTHAVLDTW